MVEIWSSRYAFTASLQHMSKGFGWNVDFQAPRHDLGVCNMLGRVRNAECRYAGLPGYQSARIRGDRCARLGRGQSTEM
jgi:hypothetical protein